MVGSGPYVVTEFDRGRIIRMTATRTSAARSRSSTRSSGSSTATATRSSARSRSARSTSCPRSRRRASRASARPRTSRRSRRRRRRSPQLAFNLCCKKNCPDAKFNPAVQDVTVRQAIAYAIDRERINEIATRGTSFAGHGLLPQLLQGLLRAAGRRLPARRRQGATRCSTTPAGSRASDGIRAKGGQKLSFDLFVRSESQENIQDARLVKEMTKPIGVDFKVQVVSVGQADRDHHAEGQRQDGAGLRHVHLGLGRRPVRPEPAAQPADHEGDRRLVGLVLLQPRVRPALRRSRPASSTRPSARRSSSR